MLKTLRVRLWEKRNRTDCYGGVVEVWVGSIQYEGIETFGDWKVHMNFLVWFFAKIFSISPDQNMSRVGKMLQNPFLYADCKEKFIFWEKVLNYKNVLLISSILFSFFERFSLLTYGVLLYFKL